jgi:hypothetical protein
MLDRNISKDRLSCSVSVVVFTVFNQPFLDSIFFVIVPLDSVTIYISQLAVRIIVF